MELSALVDGTLSPDLAPVSLDDLAYRGQAHTRALKIVAAVKALERTKEPVGEAHVKTGTIVADREGVGGLNAAFESDAGSRCFAAVLPGIAQQVFKCHAQQGGVTLGNHARLDLDLNFSVGGLLAQIVDDVLGQLRKIDRFIGQRNVGELGQRKQRIDHAIHSGGGAHDTINVVITDPVEEPPVVFLQDFGKTLHHADGRTEVMRDGVAEGRLLVAFDQGWRLDLFG
jgi:hypothetical protein